MQGPPEPGAPPAAPIVRLELHQRDGVAVVGGLVAETADVLGLAGAERARLRTFVQEVVEAIVADSFAGRDDLDLSVGIERRPGAMAVVIDDRGAPSLLAQGTPPPRIADLVRLGFADGFTITRQGRAGNRTEVLKNLHYASIGDDAAFGAAAEAEALEELATGPDGEVLVDIRPMTTDDVVEVARLFYRVYGYSAYYAPVVYEPERLAEYVAAGRHLGTVAVLPSGRIVGHLASEVEHPGARTSLIGLLAVEPAFRSRHLASRLGWAHVVRLVELGFVGQFTEAVTLHTRSQELALASGGHETGLLLAAQRASLDVAGFGSGADLRRAVVIFYGSIGETPAREVHVPTAYADVASLIYTGGALPRTIVPRRPRPPDDVAERSRFRVRLSHESSLARLTVEEYGADFDAALHAQLLDLRTNRFEVVWLMLPLRDPHTAFYGDGLQELGLSFAGIYPEHDDGDVLVLQAFNGVEVPLEGIEVASPLGEQVRDVVIADYRKALEGAARTVRSRARMARVFEALQ